MMVQALTTRGESNPRWIEDPIRELMAGLIANCKAVIEDLQQHSTPLLVASGPKADRARHTYVKPVVSVLGWLAEPNKVGTPFISFDQCCEYLNLNSELIRERLISLIQRIPQDGINGLHWYINRLVSNREFCRKHYLIAGGFSETDD